jgi:tetratricopeptide (TPR) repeat protein
MNKRFLVFLFALLVGGGLAWLVVTRYLERETQLPAFSSSELGKTNANEAPESASLAPVPPTKSVRLAIGSLGLLEQSQSRQLEDLVTAALKGANGLELVDRQALAKVLREQELSLSGVARAKDAVRVGKLVAADWFLLAGVASVRGTNLFIPRIVDARTGIIVGIDVLERRANPREMADELVEFALRCRRTAAEPKFRAFIAFGEFVNLSVNNRQNEFPTQLRDYLSSAYRHSNLTLLERDSASLLLQEVRLDLAGLTDKAGATPPLPLCASVWLVDGLFQSIGTNSFEVEVDLEVKRAFGDTFKTTMRGKPEDLFGKIKNYVDTSVVQASAAVPAANRWREISEEFEKGKDLLVVAWGVTRQILPNGARDSRSEPLTERRHRNVAEAIRAFETVLLLDHDNREAKLYLAAAFEDWTIARFEEAADYYRELLKRDRPDEVARRARQMLRALIGTRMIAPKPGDDDGIETPPAGWGSNKLSQAEQRLFENFQVNQFVGTFRGNRQAAAEKLIQLWPELKLRAGDRAPRVLATIVACLVDTNSAIIAQFEKSLDACVAAPEKVADPNNYFSSIAIGTFDWCFEQRLFPLALKIIEGKRLASQKVSDVVWGPRDNVRLGYALVRLERWREALNIFEELGEEPFEMDRVGPWGSPFKPFVPANAVSSCKKKLGLAEIKRLDRFEFGPSVMCLHTPSAFVLGDGGLWVAMTGLLTHVDFNLQTNLQTALPVTADVPITAMLLVGDRIWIATQGEGLIDYHKSAKAFRRISEDNGLLANDISSVLLQEKTMWIGFGRGGRGGLGTLQLESEKAHNFDQPLPRNPISRVNSESPLSADPSDGPPWHTVSQLASAPDGEIWMLIAGRGLRRHHPGAGLWDAPSGAPEGEVVSIVQDGNRLVVGLSLDQVDVSVAAKRGGPAAASGVGQTNMVMTSAQLRRFDSDSNNPLKVVSSARGKLKNVGTLAIYDFRESRWLQTFDSLRLPAPPTTLLPDDNYLWVGGWGYIGLLDVSTQELKSLCYIPSRTVDGMVIANGFLWAKFDGHLHRVALADTHRT